MDGTDAQDSVAVAWILTGRPILGWSLSQSLRDSGMFRSIETGAAARPATPATVLVVDLDQPDRDWREVVGIARMPTLVRRVGFYDRFSASHARQAFELGLTQFFTTDLPIVEIVEVVCGQAPAVTSTRVDGVSYDEVRRLATLTPRELQVLSLLASGSDLGDVSDQLGLTLNTIRTHRRRAYTKLGIASQSEAAALLSLATRGHHTGAADEHFIPSTDA